MFTSLKLVRHNLRPFCRSLSTFGKPNDQKIFNFDPTTSPYETAVRRRRVVEDPSVPKESVECLKWTNWRMHRDIKRRHQNANYWQYRLNLMSVAYCRTLPSIVRDMAIEDRNSCPREASVTYLRNRCALSSRNRGNWYRYRLSRIVWRDLADHGMISGAIRAKWG